MRKKLSLPLNASLIGALALLGLLVLPTGARADACTSATDCVYSLGMGNAAISGYTGPYGSVEVTLTSSNVADILFTANTADGFVFTGQGVGVNANGTSTTSATITTTSAPWNSAPTWAVADGSHFDGFGAMSNGAQTSSPTGAFNGAASTVEFTLTLNSGSWLNAASVLTGELAAAHIGVCTSDGSACTSNQTGFITTGFAAVPGPTLGEGLSGLWIAGAGLLLFALRRRKAVLSSSV